ncbi:hypothetical protein CXG81DRAFT_27275 [Caulochytrium protostelioides]|uniref:Uncharacterized protein n=1 Tax=Caulochytrium protostelioides TaxID=1555241 RepID=A0A4P9X4K2_9FUNG|nr:hypothetical protein CXG81DRAFT_27275 [Caulochytrium protostelioides]|eukprot:RKO99993.1 hypothetical protein CXG81DRAFT_27275 [Caulochytrium protostelioides]
MASLNGRHGAAALDKENATPLTHRKKVAVGRGVGVGVGASTGLALKTPLGAVSTAVAGGAHPGASASGIPSLLKPLKTPAAARPALRPRILRDITNRTPVQGSGAPSAKKPATRPSGPSGTVPRAAEPSAAAAASVASPHDGPRRRAGQTPRGAGPRRAWPTPTPALAPSRATRTSPRSRPFALAPAASLLSARPSAPAPPTISEHDAVPATAAGTHRAAEPLSRAAPARADPDPVDAVLARLPPALAARLNRDPSAVEATLEGLPAGPGPAYHMQYDPARELGLTAPAPVQTASLCSSWRHLLPSDDLLERNVAAAETLASRAVASEDAASTANDVASTANDVASLPGARATAATSSSSSSASSTTTTTSSTATASAPAAPSPPTRASDRLATPSTAISATSSASARKPMSKDAVEAAMIRKRSALASLGLVYPRSPELRLLSPAKSLLGPDDAALPAVAPAAEPSSRAPLRSAGLGMLTRAHSDPAPAPASPPGWDLSEAWTGGSFDRLDMLADETPPFGALDGLLEAGNAGATPFALTLPDLAS